MRTVATAGHVDHGKSSLVLALTGTDPDRFPEEQARGLTIDLGFAFATLGSGREVGFVDVPGHVRFIKNMLAGVGAVELAMLVVAANEGWMPQSEEHLGILELLGIEHGIIVLTKAGLVDDETLELAALDVEEHVGGTSFARAPVVACDAKTGQGLEGVRAALDVLLADAPSPRDDGRPRLWVDRVFAARGAGTVVSGTLAGGSLAVDDAVVVGPREHAARVRGIQTHHRQLDRVEPGSRVALNLAGVEHREVHRGDAVTRPGDWARTALVDVRLRPVAGEELPPRARVHVYAGSGEHLARLRVLDGEFGRLHLVTPLPLAPGDRLVVREPGRQRTIAGAEVLDVAPVGKAEHAPARLALPLGPRLLAARPWLALDDLTTFGGLCETAAEELVRTLEGEGQAVTIGTDLVATDALAALLDRVEQRVLDAHRADPLAAGIELSVLAAALGTDATRLRVALVDEPRVHVDRGTVRHHTHRQRSVDTPDARRLLEAFAVTPYAPPSPHELGIDAALVRALVRDGALVDLDSVLFTPAALAAARDTICEALATRGSLTVAETRDVLGSSRKYVLAILAWLDAQGVTRRRGDDRIPGPAAACD